MKGKSPSFQFYPDSWLSSTSVSLMSPAQEGAYIRLLCHCWQSEDCGIPDNDEALAELSRLRGQWKKQGKRVRDKFESIGGRLFNPRLIEERHKQAEWSRKSSEGGKRSAATRAQAIGKGGSRVVDEWLQPNGQPKVNSSSSSSSSFSNREIHDENPRLLLHSRKPPEEPDFNEIGDWFEDRMRRHPNKRDTMLAQTILSEIPEAIDPRWRKEVARVHDLWCETEAWRWKAGARAGTFAAWLTDKGWKYEPPEERSDLDRAMEAL